MNNKKKLDICFIFATDIDFCTTLLLNSLFKYKERDK